MDFSTDMYSYQRNYSMDVSPGDVHGIMGPRIRGSISGFFQTPQYSTSVSAPELNSAPLSPPSKYRVPRNITSSPKTLENGSLQTKFDTQGFTQAERFTVQSPRFGSDEALGRYEETAAMAQQASRFGSQSFPTRSKDPQHEVSLHSSIRARLNALQSDLYTSAANSSKLTNFLHTMPTPRSQTLRNTFSSSFPDKTELPGCANVGSHSSLAPVKGMLGLPKVASSRMTARLLSGIFDNAPQTAVDFKLPYARESSKTDPMVYSNASTTAETVELSSEIHSDTVHAADTVLSQEALGLSEASRTSETGSEKTTDATTSNNDVLSSESQNNPVLAELQELKAMVTSIVTQRELPTVNNATQFATPSAINECYDHDEEPRQHFLNENSSDDQSAEDGTAQMEMCHEKVIMKPVLVKRAPTAPPPRFLADCYEDKELAETSCVTEEPVEDDQQSVVFDNEASLTQEESDSDERSSAASASSASASAGEDASLESDTSHDKRKSTKFHFRRCASESAERRKSFKKKKFCGRTKPSGGNVSEKQSDRLSSREKTKSRKKSTKTRSSSRKKLQPLASSDDSVSSSSSSSEEIEQSNLNGLYERKMAKMLLTHDASDIPILLINGHRFTLQPSSPRPHPPAPGDVQELSAPHSTQASLPDATLPTAPDASDAAKPSLKSKPDEGPDYELRIKAMESAADEFREKIETLTAEKHHLTTQRDQLAQDVSAVVKEYEAQHQELLRIRAEADEASRRYATDLVDIRASRDELQKLLLVQEQHLTAAHDGLDRLEEERQRLRRELTALERLEGDKDARLKECTSLETELQTECATLRDALRQATLREEKSAGELATLRSKVTMLEVENARLIAEEKNAFGFEEKQDLLDTIRIQREECEEAQLKLERITEEMESVVSSTRQRFEQELKELAEKVRKSTEEAAEQRVRFLEEQRDAALAREQQATQNAVDPVELQQCREENDRLQARLDHLEAQMEEACSTASETARELQRARRKLRDKKVQDASLIELREENIKLQGQLSALQKGKQILERDLHSTLQASRALHQRVMQLEASGRILNEEEEQQLRDCKRNWEAHKQKLRMRLNSLQKSFVLRLHIPPTIPTRIYVAKGIQAGLPTRAAVRLYDEQHVQHDSSQQIQYESRNESPRWPSRLDVSCSPSRSPSSDHVGSATARRKMPLYKRPTKYTVSGRLIKTKAPEPRKQMEAASTPVPQWQLPTQAFEMRRQYAAREKIEQQEKRKAAETCCTRETSPVFRRRTRGSRAKSALSETSNSQSDASLSPIAHTLHDTAVAAPLNPAPCRTRNADYKEKSDATVTNTEPKVMSPSGQDLKQRAQETSCQLQMEFLRYKDRVMYNNFADTRLDSQTAPVPALTTAPDQQAFVFSADTTAAVRFPNTTIAETSCSSPLSKSSLPVATTPNQEGLTTQKLATTAVAAAYDAEDALAGSTAADTPDFGSLSSYRSDNEPMDVAHRKSMVDALREKLMGQGILKAAVTATGHALSSFAVT